MIQDSVQFQSSPLAEIFYNLINEGYTSEVALWAAWLAHPQKKVREASGLPDSQIGLADLIGVSPRTLREYKKKHPNLMASARAHLIDSVLADYIPATLHQIGNTAANVEGRAGHSDRVLLLELTGMYSKTNTVKVGMLANVPGLDEAINEIYGEPLMLTDEEE